MKNPLFTLLFLVLCTIITYAQTIQAGNTYLGEHLRENYPIYFK